MDELNIRDTNEFLFPFFFLDNYNSTKNFPNDATIIRLDFNFFDSSRRQDSRRKLALVGIVEELERRD